MTGITLLVYIFFIIDLDYFPYHGHDLLSHVLEPLCNMPSSDLSHDTSAPFLEVAHQLERSKYAWSHLLVRVIHPL
jgi:hypothetical protein